MQCKWGYSYYSHFMLWWLCICYISWLCVTMCKSKWNMHYKLWLFLFSPADYYDLFIYFFYPVGIITHSQCNNTSPPFLVPFIFLLKIFIAFSELFNYSELYNIHMLQDFSLWSLYLTNSNKLMVRHWFWITYHVFLYHFTIWVTKTNCKKLCFHISRNCFYFYHPLFCNVAL